VVKQREGASGQRYFIPDLYEQLGPVDNVYTKPAVRRDPFLESDREERIVDTRSRRT